MSIYTISQTHLVAVLELSVMSLDLPQLMEMRLCEAPERLQW